MNGSPLVGVDLRALVREPTGIGVATRSLLERMMEASDLRFLGLAHREPEGRQPAHESNGWLASPRLELEIRSAPSGVLWQQLLLPRQLAEHGVDLLWSPLQTAPLLTATPTVVTVHDLTALTMPEVHRFKVRASQRPFLGPSLRRARRIVAVSESTANEVRAHFPSVSGRVRVVPNGVDPVFEPASPARIAEIRGRLDAPEGYVLFVGTLEPRKNVGTLLDAWETLREELDGVPPLLLAGGYGWKSRRLVERIEGLRSHRVRWLGRLDRRDLVEVVQAARVLACPSLHEGFGLPAVEAMACGVPVVCSDRGGLPEVVGDAGIQVPARDPERLAAALRRLLEDPALAADLGSRGRERARRFSWERSAELMAEVFREALGESR